jgi:hypothetical protein
VTATVGRGNARNLRGAGGRSASAAGTFGPGAAKPLASSPSSSSICERIISDTDKPRPAANRFHASTRSGWTLSVTIDSAMEEAYNHG